VTAATPIAAKVYPALACLAPSRHTRWPTVWVARWYAPCRPSTGAGRSPALRARPCWPAPRRFSHLASCTYTRCAAADSGVFRANSGKSRGGSLVTRSLRRGLTGIRGSMNFIRFCLQNCIYKVRVCAFTAPLKKFKGQMLLLDLTDALFSSKSVKVSYFTWLTTFTGYARDSLSHLAGHAISSLVI
jgi:hypothetical protein